MHSEQQKNRNIAMGAIIGALSITVLMLIIAFGSNASWLAQNDVEASLISTPLEEEQAKQSITENAPEFVPADPIVGESLLSTTGVLQQKMSDATGSLTFSAPDDWVLELDGDKTFVKPDPKAPNSAAVMLVVQDVNPSISLRGQLAEQFGISDDLISAYEGSELGIRADNPRASVVGIRNGAEEVFVSVLHAGDVDLKNQFEYIASTLEWL